jgi:DNA-binding LytR/AlgR family response regulator
MADNRFICSHTSFAVNMDYVKTIQEDSLLMKTDVKLPIARRMLPGVKEKYLQYFFKR